MEEYSKERTETDMSGTQSIVIYKILSISYKKKNRCLPLIINWNRISAFNGQFLFVCLSNLLSVNLYVYPF